MDAMEIVRHRQIDGLSLFLDTVDYRTSHFHSEWELIWVLRGSLHLTCEQKSYTLERDGMFLICPYAPHEFYGVGSPCTFLCVQIAPRRFMEIAELTVESAPVDVASEEASTRKLQGLLLQAAYAYFGQAPFYELECLGCVGLCLHMLMQKLGARKVSREEEQNRTKRNARLRRLQQFVESNYMHKIRLSDFAETEACSMSYLSHFVKEAMHQTFQDYVSTVRFHCACKLIAAGGMNMLDVCMESGFSDYRYFVKTFRKMCGMTPEAYSRSYGAVAQDAPVQDGMHPAEVFYTAEKSIAFLDGCKTEPKESTDNPT